MGQILHKRAATTHTTRQYIQDNKHLPAAELAEKFNINIGTVKKWQSRDTTEDLPMGNGRTNSVLTRDEDTLICHTRRVSKLPLDDLLALLKPVIPKLSRSNLGRCLQYYGISKLSDLEAEEQKDLPPKSKFKLYELGFVHVDITEFWLDKTKWYLFVAIERKSKMAFVQLFQHKTAENACTFLAHADVFFPFKIHTVLTDNGTQFTYRGMPKLNQPKARHPFYLACKTLGARHRLTAFYSPQTNGLVERFNRTIKERTLRLFEYLNIEQFSEHLAQFVNWYNTQKKLKALRSMPPYDMLLLLYKQNPKLFKKNPNHHCVGLNK